MSFSRCQTPRNHSFYQSDSPHDAYKYRPQSANSTIYKRIQSATIIPSKGGRMQNFILIGDASCNDPNYDVAGVARYRCLQSESRKSCLPSPGQYNIKTKHIISRSQTRTQLKIRRKSLGLKNPNEKHVNPKRFIPSSTYKRYTVPKFTNGTKTIWSPCGDAQLQQHPGPGSYYPKMQRSQSMTTLKTSAKRAICTKETIKQPLVVTAKSIKKQRRRSRNDKYQQNKKRSDWRITHKYFTPHSFDRKSWNNSLRFN